MTARLALLALVLGATAGVACNRLQHGEVAAIQPAVDTGYNIALRNGAAGQCAPRTWVVRCEGPRCTEVFVGDHVALSCAKGWGEPRTCSVLTVARPPRTPPPRVRITVPLEAL